MARGFFSGVVWGAAVSTLGLSILSLSAPLPQSPEAATEAPADVTAAPAPADEGAGMEAAGLDADLVEVPPTAPVDNTQASDTLDPMAAADTEPAALPEVGDAGDDLGDPAEPLAGADVAASDIADAAPQSASPDAPEVAASDAAPEAVAPPAVPQVGAVDDTLGAPDETGTAPELATATEVNPAVPSPDAPAVVAPEDEVALPIATDPAQPSAPDVTAETAFAAAPEADSAPRIGGADDPAVSVPNAEGITAPGFGAVQDPDIDDTPATAPDASDTSRRAALPQVGDSPAAAPDAPAPLPGTAPSGLTDSDALSLTEAPQDPPITAFAVPFDNSEDKPIMSIILIDGPDAVGAEALADFPYPLTFAIDPTDPGALDKMQARRDAGFEVVALIDLPAAALPTDAEVALTAALNALPESVAVLEGIGSGIQGNRPLSDQVTEIVSVTGHGLITQDNGLNTVPKLAARSGVPTATVFRDFDGAGQTPTVMRRFLDQAAFRAGQQGGVVMLGRVQPDTISALLLWGLQDRANRVALAPISALLTK